MMRLLLLLLLLLHPTTILTLWPKPQQLEQGQELIRLANNFTINFRPPKPTTISIDLASAISTTLNQLQTDNHQPLTTDRGRANHKRLTTTKLKQLSIELTPKPPAQQHHLTSTTTTTTGCDQEQQPIHSNIDLLLCHHPFTNSNYHQATTATQPQSQSLPSSTSNGPSIVAEMQYPLKARDEAYEIKIQATDHTQQDYTALLSANSALGLLRGLQTFSQLVYTLNPPPSTKETKTQKLSGGNEEQAVRYIQGPLHIKDQPAFPYRGLLLDTSRNYYSIDSLKKTIKTMSAAKLNILHWHIVDSQSWPLQIPFHPQLADNGAYSEHETYSVEEIIELTHFANARGVEILLEIDTPGHTAIIGESFPELIACKNKAPWSNYAAEPPAGQLRIADDRALALVNEIFDLLTTQIPGTLFSSGGDEVNKKCYEEDGPTQASLRAKNENLSEALTKFVMKTHETIRRSGKVPVVWEELVLDEAIPLAVDQTLVTVWRNSSMVQKVVQKGYSIIHGASDYSYLDCGLGGWLGNSINGTSWCDPFKTWQKIYSFDPYKNVEQHRHKQVLGGQALLWSEQTDEQNMDGIIWPRALSTAEVYWTGNQHARSVSEALPRMHDMRYRLVQRGVRAAPLQPHWCALRPGQCDLPAGTQED
ncbi:uncharacterized protein PGTG_17123 [Puccinia graminis f. sp. tritici CRL 75-36-700-3]|uniref:Beta-hexosaminidase n=1 Tax=Puccinia graminis f. sp. tritici (strain CRL 75-36-700-3 / race SCCL) TaxID=418459 RepID=E3L3Z1_PUCGT|nr:uncharacterized protein PGTG_17123 [Puccinia graminis f. sp. tritici CRL 75-36-700-3]EFP91266.2 hypothetical protein PGTG_17123 [Puccinia graminis f. sp. tritici CRL 75-36-700-3]